ncbi:hypothetical protein PIB30_053639 [Stylosanthes scabra]|uniref:Uncharacterized protein n=1 Tax=Stylosanthes scabra TaxID=79078 RepID=A0ABU6WLX6_9FABA|nr:hypothetical protein [Stylosanthes scabra]
MILLSLTNQIDELKREIHSLTQRLDITPSTPSSMFKVFGLSSKKRARYSSVVQVAPGLELPSWMHLSFRPTALMGLNQDEVAVAAYLYGNLSHNEEEEIVFSNVSVGRQEFKSLIPGNAIHLNVLTMVTYMMTKELGLKSGYWFLPPFFATYALGWMKTDPKSMAVEFNNIFMGKVDCLKRTRFPLKNSSRGKGMPENWNDSDLWVASWMIGRYDDDDFDIKVDDRTRMKIVVSLVLKDHNIINQTIKTNAIENLEQQDEDHDFRYNYAYQS